MKRLRSKRQAQDSQNFENSQPELWKTPAFKISETLSFAETEPNFWEVCIQRLLEIFTPTCLFMVSYTVLWRTYSMLVERCSNDDGHIQIYSDHKLLRKTFVYFIENEVCSPNTPFHLYSTSVRLIALKSVPTGVGKPSVVDHSGPKLPTESILIFACF